MVALKATFDLRGGKPKSKPVAKGSDSVDDEVVDEDGVVRVRAMVLVMEVDRDVVEVVEDDDDEDVCC